MQWDQLQRVVPPKSVSGGGNMPTPTAGGSLLGDLCPALCSILGHDTSMRRQALAAGVRGATRSPELAAIVGKGRSGSPGRHGAGRGQGHNGGTAGVSNGNRIPGTRPRELFTGCNDCPKVTA